MAAVRAHLNVSHCTLVRSCQAKCKCISMPCGPMNLEADWSRCVPIDIEYNGMYVNMFSQFLIVWPASHIYISLVPFVACMWVCVYTVTTLSSLWDCSSFLSCLATLHAERASDYADLPFTYSSPACLSCMQTETKSMQQSRQKKSLQACKTGMYDFQSSEKVLFKSCGVWTVCDHPPQRRKHQNGPHCPP